MHSLHGQVSPLETRGSPCSQDPSVSLSIRRTASSGSGQTSSRVPSILFLITHSLLGYLCSPRPGARAYLKVRAQVTSGTDTCSLLNPWHLGRRLSLVCRTSGQSGVSCCPGVSQRQVMPLLEPDLEMKQTRVGNELLALS